MAEREVTEEDRKKLVQILTHRHGKVMVIPVESNPYALIIRTTNAVAPILRESSGEIRVGGKTFTTLLTSGSIGKLKRRASGSEGSSDGKVP